MDDTPPFGPITLAQTPDECAAGVLTLEGHLEAGATVDCPHGPHTHELLTVFHTELVDVAITTD